MRPGDLARECIAPVIAGAKQKPRTQVPDGPRVPFAVRLVGGVDEENRRRRGGGQQKQRLQIQRRERRGRPVEHGFTRFGPDRQHDGHH